jgi:hypothetical protein
MTRNRLGVITVAAIVAAGALPIAQHRPGGMGGPGQHDGAPMDDMRGIHALLDQRALITRQVTVQLDGVDTLTQSDSPDVARLIQTHVAAMYARVEAGRPIHARDPLFREVFAHAGQIDMRQERTAKGVRVVETSTDPYVARLIQAHAEVVSAFIANGRSEMMRDHPVPARPH